MSNCRSVVLVRQNVTGQVTGIFTGIPFFSGIAFDVTVSIQDVTIGFMVGFFGGIASTVTGHISRNGRSTAFDNAPAELGL